MATANSHRFISQRCAPPRGRRLSEPVIRSGGVDAMRLPVCLLTVLLVILLSPVDANAGGLGDLRETLKAPVDDLEKRELDLHARGRELHTLGELTQALFLQEWRDDDLDPNLAAT